MLYESEGKKEYDIGELTWYGKSVMREINESVDELPIFKVVNICMIDAVRVIIINVSSTHIMAVNHFNAIVILLSLLQCDGGFVNWIGSGPAFDGLNRSQRSGLWDESRARIFGSIPLIPIE